MASIGSDADPDIDLGERTENAILNLANDRVAREVLEAGAAAGVECILFKGPVTERWLYGGEPVRRYADVDLLTSPAHFERMRAVLGGLGFEIELDDRDTPGWVPPAHHWRRDRDGANVDLHRHVWGARDAPERVWGVVEAEAERMDLDGLEVRIPGEAFRALHLALHALQHANDPSSHSREALRTGLEKLPPQVWGEASRGAELIGAEAALAAGLGLETSGSRIARELGLSTTIPPELARRAAGEPEGSHGLDTLLAASRQDRVRHVARKLFPTRRFMRAWSPLARRGPIGMALAYAGRPFWVGWRAVIVMRWRLAARR